MVLVNTTKTNVTAAGICSRWNKQRCYCAFPASLGPFPTATAEDSKANGQPPKECAHTVHPSLYQVAHTLKAGGDLKRNTPIYLVWLLLCTSPRHFPSPQKLSLRGLWTTVPTECISMPVNKCQQFVTVTTGYRQMSKVVTTTS